VHLHRGSGLLQFSDFLLPDFDVLAQPARNALAQSWRLQPCEHAGKLLTLLCERLLCACARFLLIASLFLVGEKFNRGLSSSRP